ncbi:alpha/beta fold hydrolase, partial [Klebsiella pneumoniae]|uniref:alpha/beta fold hydrolase n=1 Tax=Klebsiella pneumoniae TaxID=573 RepID=UPI0034D2DA63
MERDPGVRHVRLETGVSLAYSSTGPDAATPVLLLHAWAESRRSFDRLLQLLPGSVHAMAIDQRGHGDAEKPAHGYSLEDLAGD